MRFEVEIPEDVTNRLVQQATASGSDVVHLIQMAVVRFVQDDAVLPTHRLRPDALLDEVEISPPVELPLSRLAVPVPVTISKSSRLRPDPVPDAE